MDDLEKTIGSGVTMHAGATSSLGRIDQYELVRELGGGGFGCVYLAKDTVAGIEVAVKGLPPEVRHNKEELENIRENFALVSRLHHPNIAAALVLHPVREVSYANRDAMEKLRVFEGDTLMVMEYAPGTTLSSWRKQFPGKRVPLDVAVDVLRQIASALDYAHERKIIHRDIKPANVMIEPLENGGNAVRILDFGLAAEIRSSMGRVSREIRDMSGTRPYMAPEQWGGEKQGPATDQYALAVLLCELVSGEVPYQSAFETGDSVVMMANVIHNPVKLPEGVPERVRAALLRALSKKPSGRYPTCTAFAEAVSRRAIPWRSLVIGLLVLALCAGGAWRLFRDKSRPVQGDSRVVEQLPERVPEQLPEQLPEETPKTNTVVAVEPIAASPEPERVLEPVRPPEPERVPEPVRPPEPVCTPEPERVPEPVRPPEPERVPEPVRPPEPPKPPSLWIVARVDGKEVLGAKMKAMDGERELPCKWDRRLSRGRPLGPYDVTYSDGRDDYHGTFRILSVDWDGERTNAVDLVRGKLAPKYKGTGRWF